MKHRLFSSPTFYLVLGLVLSAVACSVIDLVLNYDPPVPSLAAHRETADHHVVAVHSAAPAMDDTLQSWNSPH